MSFYSVYEQQNASDAPKKPVKKAVSVKTKILIAIISTVILIVGYIFIAPSIRNPETSTTPDRQWAALRAVPVLV